MDNHAIEIDQYGAYQVRVTKQDGGIEIIPGFPSWGDAQAWVNARLRESARSPRRRGDA
jgi:hypothetical protein